jgi:DNA topoisomerase IA
MAHMVPRYPRKCFQGNSMPVVVVESPAKAKTINKYLGSNYVVLASYGHVRDLPPKDGSVDTEHEFEMKWEVAADSKKHINAIKDALKTDDELILATDPDREGEAISWHLQEALASSLKKGKKVSRVTFNAITKEAVTEAMKHPRQVDQPLVDAYLARRALDYLVGLPCRRCCGANCQARGPLAACNRFACVWWSSARWRSRLFAPANSGPFRRFC